MTGYLVEGSGLGRMCGHSSVAYSLGLDSPHSVVSPKWSQGVPLDPLSAQVLVEGPEDWEKRHA